MRHAREVQVADLQLCASHLGMKALNRAKLVHGSALIFSEEARNVRNAHLTAKITQVSLVKCSS